MKDFYFGTPFLSKQAAVNWDQSVALLNSMLASFSNQTSKNFHHLIACHEIPPIAKEFESFVTFIQLSTPIPKNRSEMLLDKGMKKQAIGCYLRNANFNGYLMLLDAVDFVHKDLVKYSLKDGDKNGYLINKGCMCYQGSKKIIFVNENFDKQCGSCAIFNLKNDELPTALTDENNRFSQFKSHRDWVAQ